MLSESPSFQLTSGLKLAENEAEEKELETEEAIVRAVDVFHLGWCFLTILKDMEDSVDDLDAQKNAPPLLNVPGIRKTFCDGLGQ